MPRTVIYQQRGIFTGDRAQRIGGVAEIRRQQQARLQGFERDGLAGPAGPLAAAELFAASVSALLVQVGHESVLSQVSDLLKGPCQREFAMAIAVEASRGGRALSKTWRTDLFAARAQRPALTPTTAYQKGDSRWRRSVAAFRF